MVDFSHIRAATAMPTAKYTFYELEGMKPVITLKPSNRTNKRYTNEALRRSRHGRASRAQSLSVDDLDRAREADYELLPRYCVTGWDGVLDAQGKPVPFNAENCEKFFRALEWYIFDGLREFAADPVSFEADAGADPEADLSEQAGN